MTVTERIQIEFLPKFKTYKDHGDYNCWGFESIMNLRKDYDGFIGNHYLPEGFETWLYYAPSDYRMVLIDFSNIDKGMIDLRDGSIWHAKDRDIIQTLTIDEFLDYYGSKIIMSVGHWKVKWIKYGVGWDN